jgi:hypothetical protein
MDALKCFLNITHGVLLYMKYIAKYLSLGLLLSTAGMLGGCCPATPTVGACAPIRTTWVPITVGQNLYTQYHKLLFPEGFEEYEMYDDCEACSWATDFSITYRFIQSRNASQVAGALWGSPTLIFAGWDNAPDAGISKSLVAEYYGMGPDTDASISLCPRMRNQVIDFQLAISGAKCWAQINLPLTWAKWATTTSCGAPAVQGTYGTASLDGANLEFTYPPAGGISINGTALSTPSSANNVWFDGVDATVPAIATSSITLQIAAQELTNVNTDGNASVDKIKVTYTNAATAATGEVQIGNFNMGLYGAFDAGGAAENVGVIPGAFSTADVAAAPDLPTALGGYTFGMVKQRNNNLFNFNPCGKWGLADIPIMLGYDFCKSDASHIGAYLKFVIPTGTKIDQCFLQYVLTPVIGNGRHFEFGIGLSAHANVWVCDSSSFGVYGDGYIDYMFGACQTRTFDLPNQPMSRYTLVYPLTGSEGDGYTQEGEMVAVGDVNLYQGNVTACRGEFMFDFIWACRNFEVGLGYAFTGQSSEKINCGPCATLNGDKAFAIVGDALQQSIGVGPIVIPLASATLATAQVTTTAYVSGTSYPQANFFYLGSTGNAAEVAPGLSSAYTYGDVASIDNAAFLLPNVQGNCSGLMSGQVLNRIFGHIDYVWRDCAWQPEIGIVGSIGFVPAGKPTANYWDLGARVGFAF